MYVAQVQAQNKHSHEAKGTRREEKMNKRKLGSFALSVMLLALSLPVAAQQPKKVPRIGFILGSSPGPDARIEGFRQGLRELAYVEGQNIAIEWRYAEGKEELVPKLAAELVQLNVEIIVTDGTNVTRAAKNATRTIPIVMASDADPVGNGFVASLARPGGNVTGLVALLAELSGKRLELLKEAIPGISRVGILWNPENPSSVSGFKETQEAARALAMQLQSLEVRGADDFAGAFQAATKARARALTVVSDSLMFSNRRRLLELAIKNKLPTMHTQSLWADAGALMSYGTNFPDLHRRAAIYVDKILKGAKPAELPVEQPKKFELVINLKTAKQIGLTIPPNVLARADRVIR
jgi:putative tryptophan/tyrosine transport system substrate-binding protein